MKRTALLVIFFVSLWSMMLLPVSSHRLPPQDLLKNAWIKQEQGYTIAYLHGSHYMMGFQQGSLLSESCYENLRALKQFAYDLGLTDEDFNTSLAEVLPYIPEEYVHEMQGLADALDLPLHEVEIGNIMTMWIYCSGFIAWGPATHNGSSLVHARSFDFFLTIQDPISGQYAQDNAVVFIRDPDDGYASIDPSFAGFVGSTGGFNERGISVDVLVSWTKDMGIGTPIIFHLRSILDHAATAEEALAILDTNQTHGWNFLLSEETPQTGYAVEQTKHHLYVGTWDDPEESHRPFWVMDHVVRRTNLFLATETAATQRDIYNPKVLPFLGTILKLNNLGNSAVISLIPWYHYKVLSDSLQKEWGSLNLTTSMELLRDVYNGRTDFLFGILQRHHGYNSLIQWTAEPRTGDILLSYAKGIADAHTQPVTKLNLFELLSEASAQEFF